MIILSNKLANKGFKMCVDVCLNILRQSYKKEGQIFPLRKHCISMYYPNVGSKKFKRQGRFTDRCWGIAKEHTKLFWNPGHKKSMQNGPRLTYSPKGIETF